jgi:hypothetical protein
MRFNKIIQAGMTSSGTTVVYQVLRHLVGNNNVDKRHEFVTGGNNTGLVITHRDFRCLCTTTFRRHHITPSRAAIDNWFKNNFLVQFAWFSKFEKIDDSKILRLKYDDYFEKFEFMFDALETFLVIDIGEKQREKIAADCCIAKNQQRQKAFKGFLAGQVCHTYRIFGDHCGTGAADTWRTLSPELQVHITKLVAPYLLKYGFELGIEI